MADGEKKDQLSNQATPAVPTPDGSQLPGHIVEQMSVMMERRNPIAEKVTEEHITQTLKEGAEENKRNFAYAQRAQLFNAGIFVVVVAVFVFLVIFLKDNPEILAPMLTAILGFGSGFGIGKRVS